MKSNELKWIELSILLLVVILGTAAFSFYYIGMSIGYLMTPLLVMQLLGIIVQLVTLLVLYKIYLLLVKEKLKK